MERELGLQALGVGTLRGGWSHTTNRTLTVPVLWADSGESGEGTGLGVGSRPILATD